MTSHIIAKRKTACCTPFCPMWRRFWQHCWWRRFWKLGPSINRVWTVNVMHIFSFAVIKYSSMYSFHLGGWRLPRYKLQWRSYLTIFVHLSVISISISIVGSSLKSIFALVHHVRDSHWFECLEGSITTMFNKNNTIWRRSQKFRRKQTSKNGFLNQ
jgi:hypothetical protein